MSRIKQIIRLGKNGTSLQAIARGLGISRNTVKKYLRLIEVKGYDPDQLLKEEDDQLEALLNSPATVSDTRFQSMQTIFPHIEKELKRTGVTRWILWGEYKKQHPDGYGYSRFCDHFRQWLKGKDATMHFEHAPGDKLYIDYAGKKLSLVNRQTGEITEVEVYIAILGYSQLTYVEAISSQRKEDFIRATENALHYFGGVPRVLVPDNLKSAVTKASKYEADINTDFADFANHYNTSVLPARSYKPRDKSLVENAVNIAYSRIYAPLRNEVFHSVEALNQAIRDLLEAHNQKPFQQSPTSRREKFDTQERTALMPLANQRYEIKHYKTATVMKNTHVRLSEDQHYYSVPYRYIGRKVKIIYSAQKVAVYYQKERIALHHRNLKRYAYTTVKEHLPSSHQFVSDWNPDKFIRWADRIHPVVKHYITNILESKVYPEQAYRSCVGILSQEKKVGKERLIKAVERASHFGAYSYKTIDRILKSGLDKLDDTSTEQPETTQTSLPFHDNIRGASHYQ